MEKLIEALYFGFMFAPKKLWINVFVVVICGIIAISIPIIVHNTHYSSHGTSQTDNYQLTSDLFLSETYDVTFYWQIKLVMGEKVIATWTDIYQQYCTNSAILQYDQNQFKLTKHGLIALGVKTTADFQRLLDSGYHPVIQYQGYSCELNVTTAIN